MTVFATLHRGRCAARRSLLGLHMRHWSGYSTLEFGTVGLRPEKKKLRQTGTTGLRPNISQEEYDKSWEKKHAGFFI